MANINWPSNFINNNLLVLNTELHHALAEGWFPNTAAGNRAGERLSISTTVFQDLDSGFGTEPTTPGGARVVSSSASDTTGGSGAQKVKCTYLDSNWTVKNENVTMNGTTPVSLVATDILHIDAFHVIQVGSGGVAAGNIDWQNPAGTVTFARIPAGLNMWLIARLHVPAGMTYHIMQWKVGAFNGGVKFLLRAEEDHTAEGGGPNIIHVVDLTTVTNGAVDIPLRIPIIVEEKNHAKISGMARGPNTDAYGAFDFDGHLISTII